MKMFPQSKESFVLFYLAYLLFGWCFKRFGLKSPLISLNYQTVQEQLVVDEHAIGLGEW